MPRYTYKCDNCKEVFEVSHGMFFEQEKCIKCHRHGYLTKVPVFNIRKQTVKESESHPGAVVDQFIKDAKKDLKQQRRDLKTEVFDK